MATAARMVQEQYRLHAYVCGSACVQPVENMGTMTFTMIFVRRPYDCRYAVVSKWSVEKHEDEVFVFDLYEAQEALKGGQHVTPPPPMHKGDCVDAAIMATQLVYQDN